MCASIVIRRLALCAFVALAAAVALVAGQDALTMLAEGFGWGSATPVSPADHVVAEGFGWGGPAPTDPGAGS